MTSKKSKKFLRHLPIDSIEVQHLENFDEIIKSMMKMKKRRPAIIVCQHIDDPSRFVLLDGEGILALDRYFNRTKCFALALPPLTPDAQVKLRAILKISSNQSSLAALGSDLENLRSRFRPPDQNEKS